jgi:hypothetical protein
MAFYSTSLMQLECSTWSRVMVMQVVPDRHLLLSSVKPPRRLHSLAVSAATWLEGSA